MRGDKVESGLQLLFRRKGVTPLPGKPKSQIITGDLWVPPLKHESDEPFSSSRQHLTRKARYFADAGVPYQDIAYSVDKDAQNKREANVKRSKIFDILEFEGFWRC